MKLNITAFLIKDGFRAEEALLIDDGANHTNFSIGDIDCDFYSATTQIDVTVHAKANTGTETQKQAGCWCSITPMT